MHPIKELSNGLRYIHYPSPQSNINHLAVFFNCGSRHEPTHLKGLAHFIEHTIFKGTKKRKSFHILNRIDSVGGELNAYTTKEETCIYCSFLPEYNQRAFDLLGDLSFNCIFPEKELEKEKAVILDEINLCIDTPSEQIYDDFEELLFGKHPLGRSILGTKKGLEKIKQDDALKFYRANYRPENMVVAFAGNVSQSLLEKYLSTFFEPAKNVTYSRRKISRVRDKNKFSFSTAKGITKEEKKPISQNHCILGNHSYAALNKNRCPMILLNNILGGPAMNSRLNLNIREKYGFTYQIESNYSAYSDRGIFTLYFATDNQQFEKTLALVHKELRFLKEKKLSSVQLATAKKQLKGQIALSNDSALNNILGAGKSALLYNKYYTIEELFSRVEKITSEQVLEVANDIFSTNQMSVLVYSPDRK